VNARARTVPALLRAALLKRRRSGSGCGSAPSPRLGDGYEFAEVRTYVAGDDPRHIDWAATARSETLQTRVFFEDRALTLAVCIDGSPSMHIGRSRSSYDLGCDAAELWYAIAAGEDRCIRVAEGSIVHQPRLRDRAAAFRVEYRTSPPPPASLQSGLTLCAAALPPDACLLLISDFHEIDGLEALVRTCVRRFEVTALVVRDPWFEELPLSGFVAIRDAETGRCARLYFGRKERERYAAAARARDERIREKLARYGARVGVLTEKDVEGSLLRTFL
jgi:uncharacterized protein (DUF58 family)